MQSTTNQKRIKDAESKKKLIQEYKDMMRVVAKDLRESGIDINTLTEKQKGLFSEYFTMRNEVMTLQNDAGTLENTERHFQSRAKEENLREGDQIQAKAAALEKALQEKFAQARIDLEKQAEEKKQEEEQEQDDDFDFEGGLSR